MGKKFDASKQRVYQFLQDFIDENGYPPSVREICEELNIKSTASAFSYLKALEDEGVISKSKSKNRAIDVMREDFLPRSKIVAVPLVGQVTCGEPGLALENISDVYPLPYDMFGSGEMFMLTASGDSMIEAGIKNGDKIIVKKQETARDGDIVVALLPDDGESTVKRFYRKKDHFILHPENVNMADKIVYDIAILGIVVGLIRKF